MDVLREFIERLESAEVENHQPSHEQPEWFDDNPNYLRRLINLPEPGQIPDRPDTVSAARQYIRDEIFAYLADPAPEHMLVISAAPGVGKTYAAVEIAETLASQGQRVLYAGPRHDFFQDVIALAKNPEQWYEWLPRQTEDPDTGKVQTCGYMEPINDWMKRGYNAMQFCAGICGWDYVNKGCAYHLQKKKKEPIIYGQHQHVTMGHPLQFHVVIGDESPIGAFMNEWKIPFKFIAPTGLDPQEPFTEMLHRMADLAEHGGNYSGLALLNELGGAEFVADAISFFRLAVDAIPLAPKIFSARDVEKADFFHLPQLVRLLEREARSALLDQPYPGRVLIENGGLTMLLRRPLNERLPPHVIWLDATAEKHLYESLFHRSVKIVRATPELKATIYQVYDRANNKHVMTGKQTRDKATEELAQQIAAIVKRKGYQNPALVSYKYFVADMRHGSEAKRTVEAMPGLYFYAARGTNSLEGCDALIVAGTPQLNNDVFARTASMIFSNRMTAFDTSWRVAIRPYAFAKADGTGLGYPVSGYWGDPDLTALLWSTRDAEIIQAAHRVRPVLKPVDIWLLTNLPIAELPPDHLLTIREAMGAPAEVDVFSWDAVLWYATNIAQEQGYVTTADLITGMNLHRHTASKYIKKLWELTDWENPGPTAILKRGPGRPPAVAKLVDAQ